MVERCFEVEFVVAFVFGELACLYCGLFIVVLSWVGLLCGVCGFTRVWTDCCLGWF